MILAEALWHSTPRTPKEILEMPPSKELLEEIISTRFTQKEADRIADVAEKLNVSRTTVIRCLVLKGLRKTEDSEPPGGNAEAILRNDILRILFRSGAADPIDSKNSQTGETELPRDREQDQIDPDECKALPARRIPD